MPEIDDTILSRLNHYAVEHRYPGEIDADESEVFADLEMTGLLVEQLLGQIENLTVLRVVESIDIQHGYP